MNEKLISFIIKAEKGFFKKPDINDGIYLTYNMIHKPAILGILGAIVGLKGYEKSKNLPEYYTKLKDIKVGVKPIGSEKGIFQKFVIYYNNSTGFANEGESKKGKNPSGATLQIFEQTLIAPSYKIYLLLNLDKIFEKQLYENIKQQEAEYLPYMGKNDYSLWWTKDEVREYDWEDFKKDIDFYIDTIFKKEEPVIQNIVEAIGRRALVEQKTWFCMFEKLPIGFNEKIFQYELSDFAYTNARLKSSINIKSDNLFKLKNDEKVIFLY